VINSPEELKTLVKLKQQLNKKLFLYRKQIGFRKTISWLAVLTHSKIGFRSENQLRLFIYGLWLAFFTTLNIGLAKTNPCDSAKTFQFKWSNDFEYQTDYYYTNGFSFQLISPDANIGVILKVS